MLQRDKAGRIIVSQSFSNTHRYFARSTRAPGFLQFSTKAAACMTVIMRNQDHEAREWYAEDWMGRRWEDAECRRILWDNIPTEDREWYAEMGMGPYIN